ncbi:MAG TPA: tRNA (adenosine(37)-N6)-dimethylallyltransferase MiaA [Anaerolineaceae bacterium]|nr:tRNA (adenosine(37)-N6)-dimethylallyltransferase MiaA [Anaerolineaceae bacterium]
MRFPETRFPLVVVVGPTAVGKTALSIDLGKRLDGEIVSADSRLFYRGMDIGTAKPSLEERSAVPHHLIDVADPDETWSLALFQRAARRAIAGIHARGRLPILVGGTGQYVRSVTQEWRLPAQPPDPVLRQALENWAGETTTEGLHARLARIDPLAAAVIEPRNLRRTIRALEVIFHTGQRFSSQRQQLPSHYELMQIGLCRPRAEIYQRVDQRIDAMLQADLVAEVAGLIAKGYSPDLPAFSAIGYREVIAYLRGEYSIEECILLMKRATHQFVRRQANWFKETDPSIHWFSIRDDDPTTLNRVIDQILLGEWLDPADGR